jgi:putative membrane-bound dehydrogenase-like protein
MHRIFIALLVVALGWTTVSALPQAKGFPEAAAPAMKPEETAKAMRVPPGFSVTVYASEPQIHQPIAIQFDDRGRLWVAEMLSYPTWKPEGNDRILILEDSDGDHKADKTTVFTDKLNCVTGFALGFGGVWVGSNPNLLFIPDRDGDDKPDGEPQVLLDGWGHQDMHELLNSFTWGPDGWLYGTHGIYTQSKVGKPGTPEAERVPVNAAVWRYHPTRHVFEVFAEGTSNPWGVDFNDQGQAFITACVIPHLYHVIQGGRYQRQSGSHLNRNTYEDLKTIADHRHWSGGNWAESRGGKGDHAAAGGGHAHAGALFILSDAFPKEYRNSLLMNNIHGNRMNRDVPERKGSGYVGKHAPDFLVSADEWFRGLSIRLGPDGAVYVSDWYDRLACHQQKPQDRTNGRVYRIAAGAAPPRGLPKPLVEAQLQANEWEVRTARRLLQERGPDPKVHEALAKILRENPDETRKLRALWALHVTEGATEAVLGEALASPMEHLRAWAIQLAAEDGRVETPMLDRWAAMAKEDASPVVRLYLASACPRLPSGQRWAILEGLVGHAEDADDHNLPLMYWYAIEPLVAEDAARALQLAAKSKIPKIREFIARRAASK